MTKDELVGWVERNKGIIFRWFSEVSRYTPYDVDDFIQDAHEAAQNAWIMTLGKGKPVESFYATFWILLQRAQTAMAHVDVAGRLFGRTHDDSEDESNPVEDVADEMSSHTYGLELVWDALLESLTEQEARAVRLVCGDNTFGEHSLRQAAEVMGVSHIRVRQLLEQVIRKASRGADKFKSVA